MECALSKSSDGFTLVEISIVMMIIGLLIGGTFGGMRLVENMQVNKTAQDLKAIESAALTFKSTYGRLPGDFVNPSTRLPNCTEAPCATGGNGNRILGTANVGSISEALTPTSEKFTFWSHLQAADLLSVGTKNTTDMDFGEGQPAAAIGGGFRINQYWQGIVSSVKTCNCHNVRIADVPIAATSSMDPNLVHPFKCEIARQIDSKIDDGQPRSGKIVTHVSCLANAADETSGYGDLTRLTGIAYYFAF
jgi:prepilin-type N-terminal cleavage/methylation domain-containing protein